MLSMKRTILLFIPLASFLTIGQANAGNSNRIRIEQAATCWSLSVLAYRVPGNTPSEKDFFKVSMMYYSGILNVLRVSQPTLRRTMLEVSRLNRNNDYSEALHCSKTAVENSIMLTREVTPVHHGAPTH